MGYWKFNTIYVQKFFPVDYEKITWNVTIKLVHDMWTADRLYNWKISYTDLQFTDKDIQDF